MISGTFKTTYRQDIRLVQTNALRFWVVVGAAVAIYLPWVLDKQAIFGLHLSPHALVGMTLTQVNLALIAVIGAVALNVLTGYTGLISLGNAAFFAVGGIAAGVVGYQWGAPFPVVLLAAALLGAVVGAVVGLPSVRIRGLYLLLATMALHFIAVYAFLRYQLAYYGVAGIIFDIPSVFGWSLENDIRWYFLLLVIAALTTLLWKNVLRTREGRAFMAVRDNDIAAAAVGVNVFATKLKAFAATSAVISMAGVLFVYYLGNATREVFTLELAIQFIAMIIIGGMGSLTGAVLGAFVWQLLPQVLDTVSEVSATAAPSFSETVDRYQSQIVNIVLGVLVFMILVFEPNGLNGIWLKVKRAFVRWPYTT